MRSFQEASEFGGGKQSDVAGSPSPDNYRILLVDHLVENAGEIFTQTCICCFPGHQAPPTRIVQHSCTAVEILYILVVRPTVFRNCAIVLSQADFAFPGVSPLLGSLGLWTQTSRSCVAFPLGGLGTALSPGPALMILSVTIVPLFGSYSSTSQ